MLNKILTIGAYGFDEERYFATLLNAKVDTFIDIRLRRGMRGSQYAFLNKNLLTARLNDLGIQYVYIRELAPSNEIRALQKSVDTSSGILKSQRVHLSEPFMLAYKTLILNKYDFAQLHSTLSPQSRNIAFFCVEREQTACHRSLVAAKMAQMFHLPVEHLMP